MKYLESFNNHKLYKRISESEYLNSEFIKLSDKEAREIFRYLKLKLKVAISNIELVDNEEFFYSTIRSSVIYHEYIMKTNDEYFIYVVTSNSSGESYHFECDEMDGLMQALKDIQSILQTTN